MATSNSASAANPDWTRVGEQVVASLDPGTRARAAVYVEPKVYKRGAQIVASRDTLVATEPSVLAFVDLEPGLNWSHACRYFVCGVESGKMRSVAAQFPPESDRLRLVYRGEAVEDWMLLTRRGTSS